MKMNCETADEAEKKKALGEWMRDYGTGLLRMSFLYLNDMQLAEDVTQETFLRAYREYGGFRGEASVKSWLTRIAINLCKDQRKQVWFSRRKGLEDEGQAAETESTSPAAEESVLQRQRNQELLRNVMALPPKSREIVLMYYYQELRLREIAEILGIPEKTVSSRLERARHRLRESMEGWWDDETEIR